MISKCGRLTVALACARSGSGCSGCPYVGFVGALIVEGPAAAPARTTAGPSSGEAYDGLVVFEGAEDLGGVEECDLVCSGRSRCSRVCRAIL